MPEPQAICELGIGVTSFNRREKLSRCLDRIFRHTRAPFRLIVADDGSEDSTHEMLRSHLIPFVSGPNRGIAWNKNRALFWLSQIQPCRSIILIEDDCFPTTDGWERAWIGAATRWGHVNNAPEGWPFITGGEGTVDNPYRAPVISGQCTSFSLEALRWVGYMDTRFGRYGHEHVEHTLRFLKLGYGGHFDAESEKSAEFLLIKGDVFITNEHTTGSADAIAENAAVFATIKDEMIHRAAWRSDDDMLAFRSEMALAHLG